MRLDGRAIDIEANALRIRSRASDTAFLPKPTMENPGPCPERTLNFDTARLHALEDNRVGFVNHGAPCFQHPLKGLQTAWGLCGCKLINTRRRCHRRDARAPSFSDRIGCLQVPSAQILRPCFGCYAKREICPPDQMPSRTVKSVIDRFSILCPKA